MGRPDERLRTQALSLPGVDEGVACAGTALEKRTLRVGKKAFLFLRPADAMFKLDESLAEARDLAARAPAACKVGASGWVTIALGVAGTPAAATLSRWIAESHALLGGALRTAAKPEKKSALPPTRRAKESADQRSSRVRRPKR